MASQPDIIHLPYNWWTERGGKGIVAIIAHNTVGYDSRAYLSRGGDLPDGSDRKVSIHVLIRKDGTIYRYVPDERGANHAGFGHMPAPWSSLNPNVCTLGFELENASDGRDRKDDYTEAQLLAMGWQINDWRRRYGKLPIFRHATIDPTRRSDTVNLPVTQIEDWATRAAAHFAAAFRTVRAGAFGAIAQQDYRGGGPAAAYYPPGAEIEIDDFDKNEFYHARDGVGFIPKGHVN